MRRTARILGIIGVVFTLLVPAALTQIPGMRIAAPQILPEAVQGQWRFLFGFSAWAAGTAFGATYIVRKSLNPLSWLAMLVPFFLSVPAWAGLGMMHDPLTDLGTAIAMILILVISVALSATRISDAVRWFSQNRARS